MNIIHLNEENDKKVSIIDKLNTAKGFRMSTMGFFPAFRMKRAFFVFSFNLLTVTMGSKTSVLFSKSPMNDEGQEYLWFKIFFSDNENLSPLKGREVHIFSEKYFSEKKNLYLCTRCQTNDRPFSGIKQWL